MFFVTKKDENGQWNPDGLYVLHVHVRDKRIENLINYLQLLNVNNSLTNNVTNSFFSSCSLLVQ